MYVLSYVCRPMFLVMYVCSQLCMYVLTYVCMFLVMYVLSYVCMFLVIYVLSYVCMFLVMWVCMFLVMVCMFLVMNVCSKCIDYNGTNNNAGVNHSFMCFAVRALLFSPFRTGFTDMLWEGV